MDFVKTIELNLKNGEKIELQMTQKLIDDICNQFMLTSSQIEEKHVKYFLIGSMKNAINVVENG